jgi:thiol-disulfide isomerase/thioredoxin
MITRLLLASILLSGTISSQEASSVYKTDQLLQRLSGKDTVYVVNFWATWCKPCVQELPVFDSLANLPDIHNKVKVLLVSLDFSEDLEKKVNPFLKRNRVRSECVLLDEVNGNDYINRFSESWTGSIPATLICSAGNSILLEKKLSLAELLAAIDEFKQGKLKKP